MLKYPYRFGCLLSRNLVQRAGFLSSKQEADQAHCKVEKIEPAKSLFLMSDKRACYTVLRMYLCITEETSDIVKESSLEEMLTMSSLQGTVSTPSGVRSLKGKEYTLILVSERCTQTRENHFNCVTHATSLLAFYFGELNSCMTH